MLADRLIAGISVDQRPVAEDQHQRTTEPAFVERLAVVDQELALDPVDIAAMRPVGFAPAGTPRRGRRRCGQEAVPGIVLLVSSG
jgi:hypothetical protein